MKLILKKRGQKEKKLLTAHGHLIAFFPGEHDISEAKVHSCRYEANLAFLCIISVICVLVCKNCIKPLDSLKYPVTLGVVFSGSPPPPTHTHIWGLYLVIEFSSIQQWKSSFKIVMWYHVILK